MGPHRGVTTSMRTQGEGGPQLAPECPVTRGADPLASRCSRLVSEPRVGTTPGEVRTRSDSAAVAAAGIFPRRLTSKGWVSPARPVSPEFPPPFALLAQSLRVSAGERPAWGIAPHSFHRKTPGAVPTQRISRKPPLQARCGKAPGSASGPPARLPGGGSKT